MTILVLGINHKTASVGLREKVAIIEAEQHSTLAQLTQSGLAESVVILSTCNRTELYLHNAQIPPKAENPQNIEWCENCLAWFAQHHQLDLAELKSCTYLKQNMEATQHLMSVACGLDSLILGEPQILGQVKQAYQNSEAFYHSQGLTFSSKLSRLFQKTFQAAKRVRSETDIGGSAVSVAYAACGLARQIFDDFGKLRFLLIGAGETIELVSRYLIQHGAKHLTVANRTPSRAQEMVARVGEMDVLSLEELQIGLNQADIVISSTGSPDILVSREMVETAQKVRKNDPMLIIDIAVPRDVEESVENLETVYAYSVDDLQHIIDQNLAQRKEAAEQAKEIVIEESKAFFSWMKQQQSSNLIKSYRQNAENIRQELLEKAQQALNTGQDPQKVLDELSYKLTNQLIHSPTQALQTMAQSGNVQGLQSFSKAIKEEEFE